MLIQCDSSVTVRLVGFGISDKLASLEGIARSACSILKVSSRPAPVEIVARMVEAGGGVLA